MKPKSCLWTVIIEAEIMRKIFLIENESYSLDLGLEEVEADIERLVTYFRGETSLTVQDVADYASLLKNHVDELKVMAKEIDAEYKSDNVL